MDEAAVTRLEGTKRLRELAGDVTSARQVVQVARVAPVVWEDFRCAQQGLLDAMEIYVGALTVRRLPVPRRLQEDLRLQRRLYGGPGRRHGRAWPPGGPALRQIGRASCRERV